MDLRKIDSYLHKWEEIVSQHSAYAHLQQQALIRDIHASFDVAEILYFLTLVPHHLEQHNHSHLIAPYQRFTIELISSFPSGELEKYQKLIKNVIVTYFPKEALLLVFMNRSLRKSKILVKILLLTYLNP